MLLEADSSHIGGRVRTRRFEDGLYGEAGAMRIPASHELTRHYVEELGLSLRPFVTSNPEAYYHLRGSRARIKDGRRLALLYNLKEGERDKTPEELWADLILSRLEEMTNQERSDFLSLEPQSDLIRSLDQMTLQQFGATAGMSADAIEFMAAGLQLEGMLTSSALTAFFHEEVKEIWTRDMHGIEAGMDRLPRELSARLHSAPRMGCEVIAIEQDLSRGKAAAVYRQGGQQHREEGDVVLCTLPLPILRTIDVVPALSGAKQRAIRQLQYESATKVLAITERRFWETDDGIYGGSTFTDLPSQATVYPSDNAEIRDPAVSSRPGVLLASFTWGNAARTIDRLPAARYADFQISQTAKIHPQLAQPGMVRHSVAWSWDDHPWARGGFAFPATGQRSLVRDAAAPEGRIYFAGEHCSLHHGWIQGALETALVAVREILTRDV